MNLKSQIEAILFFKGEPTKIKELARILQVTESQVEDSALLLKEEMHNRGIQLLSKDDSLALGTAPEMSNIIEEVRKDEISKDVGRAGLEALSIILYKSPVTRSEIDYIRGVNSTFILRNLLIRGLIERSSNPGDKRSFIYKPTFELLSFLGISDIKDLPEFKEVQEELKSFIEESGDKEEN